ncbi:hypothetical protein K2173_021473 [Erythroxylum novogranatense]|uniref:C2H2-type domain-containing protein n=1 Tax=Erythroxylum novogranatense TaxID=1862640 RepID=A0AAV8TPZ2_9ROSI|nr:hypothetical protein K2173_021473 [Erythroxylum novogranatense]
MERKSLSNSFKDHSIGGRASNNKISNSSSDAKYKLKGSWNYKGQSHGEDYLGGFSWPPRSYTCSFCKREFRSAQALGGHMNVHRRDRARLRQSPPRDGHFRSLNLNLGPKPNPTYSPPSPCSCTLTSLVSSPLSTLSSSFASCSENKKWDADCSQIEPPKLTANSKTSGLTKVATRKSILGQDGHKLLRKADVVMLDLEIGLLNGSKEDLDLELRLGSSN